MKDFFRQNGGWLFLIAFLLSILIGMGSIFVGGVDPLSNLLNTITAPVRSATSAALSWAEGVYDYVFRYDEISAELDALHQQVAELEREMRDSADAMRENEQLRTLLNLQQKRSDFVFEAARVATRSTSNWESSLTLNKGSSAGLEVGDCVITETGQLVGTISEVTYSTCTVSTLINTSTEMGGMVSRTYSAGILEGDFTLMNEGTLRLAYLSDGTQLIAGDEVVTSGMGEVYPSGLVVGYVEGVFTAPSGMTRYAVIRPAVQLDQLIEVFVIKDFDIVE